MDWPNFYPDECPPLDSEPAAGIVYRLVQNPSHLDDFRSHRELNPDQKYHVPECQACGISVFRQVEHLLRMRNRVPNFRNNDHYVIGEGHLRSEHGKTKDTHSKFGDSHVTWWLPLDIDPTEFFHVIDLGDGV